MKVMRTHILALAATAATLSATAAPPAFAQGGSPLGSLFSCDNPGSRDRTGAVVGGLTGALLGSQISKNERTLGAIVGAGVGAAAGNYIGCRMNNDGRGRAQTAVRTALETDRPQTWTDSRTGSYGRVEVVSDGYSGRQAPYAGGYGSPVSATDLRYARGIQRVYDVRPAAPAYVASGRVNVRAAPTTSAAIVDRLRPGEEVRVAGMVDGGWLAIAENDRVQGYVAASTVRPVRGMTYASGPGYGCKVVQQTISMRGYPTETQRFNACRDSRGEWRLNPI
jgi:surface antigen